VLRSRAAVVGPCQRPGTGLVKLGTIVERATHAKRHNRTRLPTHLNGVGVTCMSTLIESPEWQALQMDLELIVKATRAFNAYVFDAWDNMWCAARGFSEVSRDDLVDIVHAGIRGRSPLARGGHLDIAMSDRMGHRYLRSYGSCYVLLLRFSAPCDVTAIRASVGAALARLETLTLRLPPAGGPGSSGSEAANRA
jgi:hypothetical protein